MILLAEGNMSVNLVDFMFGSGQKYLTDKCAHAGKKDLVLNSFAKMP